MSPDNFVSVVIIFDPKLGKVLLQHRDENTSFSPNKWGLFGGHGEPGEHPQDTLIRELLEETDIAIQPADIKLLSSYDRVEPKVWRHVFYLELDSEKVRMTLNEGQGYEWVSIKDVLNYDLTTATENDLKNFMQITSSEKAGESS